MSSSSSSKGSKYQVLASTESTTTATTYTGPTGPRPIDPIHGPSSALTTKSALAAAASAPHYDGTDDWTIPPTVLRHEYFVEVTRSLADALEELNSRMIAKNDHRLITKKPQRAFGGKTVPAGFIGVWARNGRPVIALRNGNYWNFSFRHSWKGRFDLTTPIDCLGLTTVLVGQSEAAVVLDPSNRVFIVRNSGFAAYGAQGRFRVVAIVDTLNLGNEHAYYEDNDRTNGRILGWKRDVTITIKSESGPTQITLATFFLVPANNTLILQRGNELMVLKAGQHVITNPNTSFRGFLTLGERQTTFKTQPAYTVEGVPVILRVNLRYQIQDPLLLTAHYDGPLQALSNPAQSAVNSVVSRLSYQQFMRAKSIGGDVPDHHLETWLESFKTECLRDLREQAVTYGIIVHSFDVLDRELEGALGRDLELQSEQVLRNQMQATQIGLQNHIMTETQKGKLATAQVEAEQRKTIADTDYYVATKKSDAAYYEVLKQAEAEAESSALRTAQEAKNILALAEAKAREVQVLAKAYGDVPDGHAQRMQLSQFEVEKRRVLPKSTIYFEGEARGLSQSGVVSGFETGAGWALGQGTVAGRTSK
ncbi:hypothetical protein DFJ73DRAFT_809060 [Zopfochytrium polystomum]|nr:hypothetical protein DFJ73DRAFT_809060 [Zopfochytrium polystomum]